MKRLLLAAILLSPLPAIAQDATVYITPVIPTEEGKVTALKEAYRLNGNSMVGDRMIDLTAPRAVKTDRIMPPPAVAAAPEPVKVAQAPVEQNVCTRHGRKKVMRNNGKSWSCK